MLLKLQSPATFTLVQAKTAVTDERTVQQCMSCPILEQWPEMALPGGWFFDNGPNRVALCCTLVDSQMKLALSEAADDEEAGELPGNP